MKKVLTTLGILVLVSFLAAPVLANRWGGGERYGGPGDGPCWLEGRNLTDSQKAELDKLHQQFVDDTAKMREEIWNKSAELDTLLNSSDPDPKKVKALQKEISGLEAQMSEKRIDLELKARKIAPNARAGRGYGKGYGRGYGHGYGMGHHYGYQGGYGHRGPHHGYGYGPCGY